MIWLFFIVYTLKLKCKSKSPVASSSSNAWKGKSKHYQELLDLESAKGVIPNIRSVECVTCLKRIEKNAGVILRNCLHSFCKPCLVRTIKHSRETEIKCPCTNDRRICGKPLEDREIEALLTKKEFEVYLNRVLFDAENSRSVCRNEVN